MEISKEELRAQFVRKEADNLRLRDQREQQTSELNERKHKDNVKMASLNELNGLAESRSVSFCGSLGLLQQLNRSQQDRITVLESELKRLKTHLAANAGNADLLSFFLKDNSKDVSYIDDLKNRVALVYDHTSIINQYSCPHIQRCGESSGSI